MAAENLEMPSLAFQHTSYSTSQRNNCLLMGISAVMLLLVFLGFGKSFFLRPLNEAVQTLPIAVFFHGSILTIWFIGLMLQSLLIHFRQFKWHQQLGWLLACVGLIILISSIVITLNFLPGRLASGTDVEARLIFFAKIVWADFAAISTFVVFFTIAMLHRKNAAIHIPMMIFASISIIEPALYRLWGWDIFGGLDRHILSLIALSLLCLVLVLYEYTTAKKVQALTLFSLLLLLGFRLVAIYLISPSELGITFIRSMF
jgi:hypothetical protein